MRHLFAKITGLFFVLVLMTACGGGDGGGGGAAAPTAPVLSLGYQAVKAFSFTWADVSGETEYRLLENPDGVSGYTQVATIAADATSHEHGVSLPARINARYMLQACNSAGCADSSEVAVDVAQLVQAVGYVKASNAEADDLFGLSLALSGDGNTLAVGAYREDSNATGIGGDQADNNASAAGAVYVFVRDGSGAWTQQAYVKASNTGADDLFGFSLALSGDGNTLAVGAYREDSAATGIGGDQNDNSASDAGAVYVFVRDGSGAWTQQAYVKASNTEAADFFGFSLALSDDGNTLAVEASGEDSAATGIGGDQNDNNAADAGAVYVFVRNGSGAWTQQAYVKASNAEAADFFGNSLALSADGGTLAVGAYLEDSNATGIGGNQADNSAPGSGAVYVFVRNGSGAWSQQAYVKASNTGAADLFGYPVALSGDGATLAVGARSEASAATGIGGNEGDNSASAAGAVYVFVRNGSGAWSQQAYVKASNTGVGDFFGRFLALSADGGTLAVGASGEDSAATGIGGNEGDNSAPGSGAAYVFVRNGSGAWSQQAYVKASNTGAADFFGWSVALSADGATLAVGAVREASAATGIGGDQNDNNAADAGAVYLY